MYKCPDGRYRERVTLPNGKTKDFKGRTKREVIQKIANWQEEVSEGQKFAAIAESWWEEHSKTIAYNTQKPYKPALRRACEEFGSRDIQTITPQEIAAHIEQMSRLYGDKAVRTQLMIYNLIFKFAVVNGHISVNPCREISVPRGLKKGKRPMADSDNIAKIKAAVGTDFGFFAYLLLYTGLRKSEALCLRFEDFDLENRVIHITKSLYYEGNQPKVKLPKTKASFSDVPILDALLPHLPKKKKGIVFANDKGEYMTEKEYRVRWKKYVEESGVTCTPHQLRHSYTVMLYEAGVQPTEMQLLLRHAQISTTMDIYNEIRDKQKKSIFESIHGVDIA